MNQTPTGALNFAVYFYEDGSSSIIGTTGRFTDAWAEDDLQKLNEGISKALTEYINQIRKIANDKLAERLAKEAPNDGLAQ